MKIQQLFKRGIKAVKRPKLFASVVLRKLPFYPFIERLMPDKMYIKHLFRLVMGYELDLNHPVTFNEKLQWLKLYDHNPKYTMMVDKFEVKNYVASIIGMEHVIPTIGVWNSTEEIDWDKLPEQFVLKCTHDSGGIVICRDKSKLDKNKAVEKLKSSLKRNFYYSAREWPYKNVKPRILAEPYMEEKNPDIQINGLIDYKFYCFDGEPKYCQVIRDRFSKEVIDFYDMGWNHMPFVGLDRHVSNGAYPVERPVNFDNMIRICRKLSTDIPFSRVDLYEINSKEYFGEITLYPHGGMGSFRPEEWSKKLGDMINIKGVAGWGVRC